MVSGGKTNEWQSPVPVAWEFAGQEYKGLIGNGYALGYAGLDDGSSGGIAGDGIGDSGLPVATDGEGDAYPLVAPLEDYSARLWWVNPSGLAAVWLGPLTSEPYLLPAGKSLVFAEAGVSTEAFLRGPGDEDSGTSFTYSLRFYSVLPQPGKSYLVEMGWADVDGLFHGGAGTPHALIASDGFKTTCSGAMTALPFLAPEDTALAVRVTNQTGADASLLPGFSWVSPPADDTPIAKAGAAGLGLYVSPAEWDFGNVEFGKQYQTELGLKSESAAPLAISEVLIAGPDADDFAEPVVTCPGGTPLPAVLANGEFCTVDVTFLPPHGGQKDAQVWIHTDLPDAEWIYAPMSALAGPQFKLEVVLDPLAGGSATGEWIECAAGSEDCSVMLDKGTSEKLTAEPAEWYKFVSW